MRNTSQHTYLTYFKNELGYLSEMRYTTKGAMAPTRKKKTRPLE